MHSVVIDRTIAYGDVKILVARDDEHRSFIGLNTGTRQRGDWAFLQVLPSTIAQLEALDIDLHTVITRRCIGLVFTAACHEVLRPPVQVGARGMAPGPMPARRAPASPHPGRPG